ncbi:MAG: N-acetyltransferase [Desulfobacterales bacterium]|nr:N-acetyltransferase [Desulfobacterales bacterium]
MNNSDKIRKASIQDIKTIYDLLSFYGKKGELLARPLTNLYDHVRDFFVFNNDQVSEPICGCCALQFCWEDLAEIRSLAVYPQYHRMNIGTQLVEAAVEEAKRYEIKKLFTLTYKPQFFSKLGFVQIDRSELPLKIWTDCVFCIKFPSCDETAMMKHIK